MKRKFVLLTLLLLVATIASAQLKATVATTPSPSVTLSWGETTPNVTFEVYRSTTPGGEDYTQPLATGLTVMTYLDTTVVRGTTYYYTELAIAAGPPVLKSPPSNEVLAAIPTAPASPSQNPAVVN